MVQTYTMILYVYTFLIVLLMERSFCENLHVGIIATNVTSGARFSFFSYGHLGAAVPMAYETAKTNFSLLDNCSIEFTYAASQCNEKMALDVFIKLKQDYNVDAVIGPQCSKECVPVGLLASQWNIPMVSHSCSTHELSDSDRFTTFARTTGSGSVGAAVGATLRHFNWTIVAMIKRDGGSLAHIATSIRSACADNNVSISRTVEASMEAMSMQDSLHKILQPIIYKARSESLLLVA